MYQKQFNEKIETLNKMRFDNLEKIEQIEKEILDLKIAVIHEMALAELPTNTTTVRETLKIESKKPALNAMKAADKVLDDIELSKDKDNSWQVKLKNG